MRKRYPYIRSIGKVKTKKIIFDSRSRKIPVGTVLDAYEDVLHPKAGIYLKFAYRKTLVGFYDRKLFTFLKKVKIKCPSCGHTRNIEEWRKDAWRCRGCAEYLPYEIRSKYFKR